MAELPLSIFSTPGVRCIGELGVIGATEAGLEKYAGLMMAAVARTADWVHFTCPRFGYLTTVNRKKGGAKPERGAFLAVKELHVIDVPDRVLLVGFWLGDKGDAAKYLKLPQILKGDLKSRKVFDAMGDHECMLFFTWTGHGELGCFEPTIHVKRRGSTAWLLAEPDGLVLTTVVRRHPWRTTGWDRIESIEELTKRADWTIDDLLHLAPASLQGLVNFDGAPRLETGLEPTVRSFEPIEPNAMLLNGKLAFAGSRANGFTHAGAFEDADGNYYYGAPLGPAHDGVLRMRELLDRDEVDRRDISYDANIELLDDELILGSDEVDGKVGEFKEKLLVAREQAYRMAELDAGAAARRIRFCVRNGTLEPILEPVTSRMAFADLHKIHVMASYGGTSSTLRVLRNECRFQMTVEASTDLRNATAVMRGVDFGRFSLIPGSEAAEWKGDRPLTLIYYYLDLADLARLWDGRPNGWVIPEKAPDARGVVRKRLARNKGFMLPMVHDDKDGKGANRLTYCMETKELRLTLALAFFGENLKFIDGAPPPKAPNGTKYDITTRAHVPHARALTVGDARVFYGEE